jgi:hypothetical protein
LAPKQRTPDKKWKTHKINMIRIALNEKKAGLEEIREAVAAGRRQVPVEVRVIWEHGDGERLVREASRDGIQRIVAAGGNGTSTRSSTAWQRLQKTNGLQPAGWNPDPMKAALSISTGSRTRAVISALTCCPVKYNVCYPTTVPVCSQTKG